MTLHAQPYNDLSHARASKCLVPNAFTHSLASLPRCSPQTELCDFGKCWGKEPKERITNTEVLIIDEISMLSGEMLDFIELIMVRRACDEPIKHAMNPLTWVHVFCLMISTNEV